MTKIHTIKQRFICIINTSDDMNIHSNLTANRKNKEQIIIKETKSAVKFYAAIDKFYKIVYNILCRMYQMITFFIAAEFCTLRIIGI